MEPALLPVGLLQAAVEVLEGKMRLGTQEQHPPIEMFQFHGKGNSHRRVAIQMGESSEDFGSSSHLVWGVQHQEAQGDMKAGGSLPMRSGGRYEGDELLLKLLERGEDSRSIGPEGDEVRGVYFRRAASTIPFSLLWRCRWTVDNCCSSLVTLCSTKGT